MVSRTVAPLFVAAVLAASLRAQTPSQPTILAPEQQIASAVLPLPADMRAGATVWGYAPDGRLVKLRDGGNHMVCLADDPRQERFHVACYHDALEPFMARGRELRASGLGALAVDSVRLAEIAAGRIRMPPVAGLYSITGQAASYDAEANTIRGGRSLFVVYVPFATAESTGLPTTPVRGAPWLMDAGTAKAHVMYAPGM